MNKIKNLFKNPFKNKSKGAKLRLVLAILIILSGPFTFPELQKKNFFLPEHFTASVSDFVQEKILQNKETKRTAGTGQNPTGQGAPGDDSFVSDTSKINYSYTPGSQPKPSNPESKKAPAPIPDTPDVVLETDTSVNYLNSVRAEGGKPALTANSKMNEWALNHTREMVAAASSSGCPIFHTNNGENLDPYLDKNIGPIITSSVRENVGRASSMQVVLVGLRNSPGHYANMMSDAKYVGNGLIKVGTGPCKGNVYTTQIFAW